MNAPRIRPALVARTADAARPSENHPFLREAPPKIAAEMKIRLTKVISLGLNGDKPTGTCIIAPAQQGLVMSPQQWETA